MCVESFILSLTLNVSMQTYGTGSPEALTPVTDPSQLRMELLRFVSLRAWIFME